MSKLKAFIVNLFRPIIRKRVSKYAVKRAHIVLNTMAVTSQKFEMDKLGSAYAENVPVIISEWLRSMASIVEQPEVKNHIQNAFAVATPYVKKVMPQIIAIAHSAVDCFAEMSNLAAEADEKILKPSAEAMVEAISSKLKTGQTAVHIAAIKRALDNYTNAITDAIKPAEEDLAGLDKALGEVYKEELKDRQEEAEKLQKEKASKEREGSVDHFISSLIEFENMGHKRGTMTVEAMNTLLTTTGLITILDKTRTEALYLMYNSPAVSYNDIRNFLLGAATMGTSKSI